MTLGVAFDAEKDGFSFSKSSLVETSLGAMPNTSRS